MTEPVVEQPRFVVDAAKAETRNQRIVAGVLAVIVLIPEFMSVFGIYEFTDAQLSEMFKLVNALAALLLLFMAEQTKSTALYVETQVTPTTSPMKTVVEPVGD